MCGLRGADSVGGCDWRLVVPTAPLSYVQRTKHRYDIRSTAVICMECSERKGRSRRFARYLDGVISRVTQQTRQSRPTALYSLIVVLADAGVDMHAGDRLGKMMISGENRRDIKKRGFFVRAPTRHCTSVRHWDC